MTGLSRCVLLAAASILAAPAAAQERCPPAEAAAGAAAEGRGPTVLIRATAEIRELRFDSQPRAEVRTGGCAAAENDVVVTERVNLPDPVEPGVTYRDVRIGVEIRARLDVVCLSALADDPALAALCGAAAPASADPAARQQPDAPAPANPPRR